MFHPGEHASGFYLSVYIVFPETAWTDYWVAWVSRKSHGFIGYVTRGLPVLVAWYVCAVA